MNNPLITHTPFWVWPLLAALVFLGLRQTLTQQASLRRITLVPLILVGLSLMGTAQAFGGQVLALLVWFKVAVSMAWWVQQRPLAEGTRYDLASERFTLPGSWVPLGLMMGIFITKYAVGATQALNPALLQQTPVAVGVSALFGLCSGILVGRAIRLWRLAAQTDAHWHGVPQPARASV